MFVIKRIQEMSNFSSFPFLAISLMYLIAVDGNDVTIS